VGEGVESILITEKSGLLYLFLFRDLSSGTPTRHRSGTPEKLANVQSEAKAFAAITTQGKYAKRFEDGFK